MLPLKDAKASLKFPVAILIIIILNLYIFVCGKFKVSNELYISKAGFIPSKLFKNPINQAPKILKSLFIHTRWEHLIGNMLFLWVLGNRIKHRINPIKFLIFYLTCGFLSLIGFSFFSKITEVPLVGSSGAISGVLGAYLILFPKAQISTFFFWVFYFNIIKIPACIYILFWLFWQIFSFLNISQEETQIAWLVHLIGFIAGMIIILLLKKPLKK